MLALGAIVAIGVSLYVAAWVAPRTRLPLALVQVVLGALLGFVPALREVQLPSDAVLLLFLPALLFFESVTVPRRELVRFFRVIALNGTLLVVASAFAAAWAATAFGMPWVIALVLGAALAPTDATAVASLGRGLPLRQRTILRAESLVNDGTALVLYAIAVGAATGSASPTPLLVTVDVIVSYVGGVLLGIATGWLAVRMLRVTKESMHANVGLVVTPFLTFLLAELVHTSGVLAVVVCGLVISQRSTLAHTEARDQGRSFRQLTTYMLNGALFVLIGLELQVLLRVLYPAQIWSGLLLGAIVWIVLLATRGAFVVLVNLSIVIVDRLTGGRRPRATGRGLVVVTLAGFRGAVSLAAALAVPVIVAGGAPFPDRGPILFATAVVILLTLTVQGPLLPPLIRWARFPDDDEQAELVRARIEATQAALDSLPSLAAELDVDEPVLDEVAGEARQTMHELQAQREETADGPTASRREQLIRLHVAALHAARDALIRLRDESEISDATATVVETQLDQEELHLTGRSPEE